MGTIRFNENDLMTILLDRMANIPAEITDKMLIAGAEIIETAQIKSGQDMSVYDEKNTAFKHVLESFNLTAPKYSTIKDAHYIYVSIKGERIRGKKKTATRNASIAFINNYGAKKRNIAARPFITQTAQLVREKAVEAAADVYKKYIEKNAIL